jgi:glucosyl-dolichyl phosphate glucuronosyltransferase
MNYELSVVICTRNRCDILARTLESLAECEHPERQCWELIVVDNASTDDTHTVVESFSTRLPIVYAIENLPGKSNALNHAVRLTRSDHVVFIDDDVLVQRDFLKVYRDAFDEFPDANLFGGPVRPVLPKGKDAWLSRVRQAGLVLSQVDFGRLTREIKLPYTPIGANCGVRKSALGKGLFFEPLASDKLCTAWEDALFFHRNMSRGHKLIYLADAGVGHIVREDQLALGYFLERFQLAVVAHERLQKPEQCMRLMNVPRYQFRKLIRRAVNYARQLGRGRLTRVSAYLDLLGTWTLIKYHFSQGRKPDPAPPL